MYTLRPATITDIPLLATIAQEAFADDAHTQLKAANPRNPYDHGAVMQQALNGWLAVPERVDAVKAVDAATGEIVGWACWGRRGFDEGAPVQQAAAPQEERSEDETMAKASSQESPCQEEDNQSESNKAEQTMTDDPLAPLAMLTSSSMQHWTSTLMPPGAKCMYMLSIAVAPAHQHRGVGRQLVRYGTEKADVAGVYSWVHASEAGAPLFRSCGYREVGRLEVDLETWANKLAAATGDPVVRREGGDWGTYCFRYMKRKTS